jgi:ABC-2 type transport system permease protein
MSIKIFNQSMSEKTRGALLVAILIFAYVFFIGYSAPVTKDMGGLDELMKNPAIKVLIGNMTVSITSFEGLLALKGFLLMGLIVGVYMAFLAASFLAGEVEHKTCDLLLSLPVSREAIVLYRYLVMVPVIGLIAICELLGVYLSARYIGYNVDMTWFVYAILLMAVLSLAAGAISMLISALMSDGRNAALASVGVLVAMYFIETLGSSIEGLDWIRRFSLFYYQDLNSIIGLHTVNWANFAVLLGAAVVFLALAVIAFKRRDINVT